MIPRLIAMYEDGAITAHHLVMEVLQRLDTANPSVVLEPLPRDVLDRMLNYANDFRPGKMQSNYALQPTFEQVEAAKQWIEQRREREGPNEQVL